MNEKETSQVTSQLKSRIDTNRKFGAVDLDEWLFEKLNIKVGSNILDVGCGTGNHIINLAEKSRQGNFYGIDISKDSVDEARKAALLNNVKVDFTCADAGDASSLQDNFFDIIISIYALYYVKDTQKVLSVLKTKLGKGGGIAVMSPYKGNNEEWYFFLSKFMKIPDEVESVANNFMDKEVLPFAKSNFRNIRTYSFENRITVPSFEDLKKYWVSNIYHKEEHDLDFEKHAKGFFSRNKQFSLTKRALLVVMD